MFRSSTIIREFAMNLAKVIFYINITLVRFSASSLMMVVDRNM